MLSAARTLYQGRARQDVLARRLEDAEARLTSWLAASGLTHALLGLFEVALVDDAVVVIKHDTPRGDQLPLPHIDPPEPLSPPAALRIAEVEPRPTEPLRALSDAELATLGRAVLASLTAAETAPLLARHEAGVAISTPRQVFELLSPQMSALAHEQLRVLTLSTRHGLLGNHLVYQGTVRAAPVRPAEVFRPAVVQQAPGLIVAHNHPSGDPTPSPDDHSLTRQLAQAGSMLGVRVVDHIVIGGSSFYSFRESGHLPMDTTDNTTLSDLTTSPQTSVYAAYAGMMPQAHQSPFPDDEVSD